MIQIQSKWLVVTVTEEATPKLLHIEVSLNQKHLKDTLNCININFEDVNTELDLSELAEEATEAYYIYQYLEEINDTPNYAIPQNTAVSYHNVHIDTITEKGTLEKELMLDDLKHYGQITKQTLLMCEAFTLLRTAIKWQDVWC